MGEDQSTGEPHKLNRARLAGAVVAAVLLVAGGVTVFRKTQDNAPVAAAPVDIAVPAYVFPDDPFITRLLDPAVPPPAVVVLNLDNGDGDVTVLDRVADALRARKTADGTPVRVIGYVWTGTATPVSLRPQPDVRGRVDAWLEPRNGKVHYDGIFFDVTTVTCGPTPGSMDYRDHYRSLREHVQGKVPDALVVNNPGTAVPACYLDPAHRTADVFVTFEGSAAAYATTAASPAMGGGYWLGGNVTADGHYVLGDQLTFPGTDGQPATVDIDPSSFWHIVHTTPAGEGAALVDKARERHAGHFVATHAAIDGNPYDQIPKDLDAQIKRAAEG